MKKPVKRAVVAYLKNNLAIYEEEVTCYDQLAGEMRQALERYKKTGTLPLEVRMGLVREGILER